MRFFSISSKLWIIDCICASFMKKYLLYSIQNGENFTGGFCKDLHLIPQLVFTISFRYINISTLCILKSTSTLKDLRQSVWFAASWTISRKKNHKCRLFRGFFTVTNFTKKTSNRAFLNAFDLLKSISREKKQI